MNLSSGVWWLCVLSSFCSLRVDCRAFVNKQAVNKQAPFGRSECNLTRIFVPSANEQQTRIELDSVKYAQDKAIILRCLSLHDLPDDHRGTVDLDLKIESSTVDLMVNRLKACLPQCSISRAEGPSQQPSFYEESGVQTLNYSVEGKIRISRNLLAYGHSKEAAIHDQWSLSSPPVALSSFGLVILVVVILLCTCGDKNSKKEEADKGNHYRLPPSNEDLEPEKMAAAEVAGEINRDRMPSSRSEINGEAVGREASTKGGAPGLPPERNPSTRSVQPHDRTNTQTRRLPEPPPSPPANLIPGMPEDTEEDDTYESVDEAKERLVVSPNRMSAGVGDIANVRSSKEDPYSTMNDAEDNYEVVEKEAAAGSSETGGDRAEEEENPYDQVNVGQPGQAPQLATYAQVQRPARKLSESQPEEGASALPAIPPKMQELEDDLDSTSSLGDIAASRDNGDVEISCQIKEHPYTQITERESLQLRLAREQGAALLDPAANNAYSTIPGDLDAIYEKVDEDGAKETTSPAIPGNRQALPTLRRAPLAIAEATGTPGASQNDEDGVYECIDELEDKREQPSSSPAMPITTEGSRDGKTVSVVYAQVDKEKKRRDRLSKLTPGAESRRTEGGEEEEPGYQSVDDLVTAGSGPAHAAAGQVDRGGPDFWKRPEHMYEQIREDHGAQSAPNLQSTRL